MADTLDDTNEKLDELLLAFFEKLEELQCLKQELATKIKNGFFLMSKARYSMGNKSVTSLQYGDKMTATVKVSCAEENYSKDCAEGKAEVDAEQCCFKVCSQVDFTREEQESKAESPNLEEKVGENSLRRRNRVRDEKENLDDTKITEEKELKKKTPRHKNDPLKWFGVLVPTSLRQCQEEFKSSCELVCDISQLELELNKIILDFKKLKVEKNKIKS